MSKYARGHLAWGICGRSGRKMLLKDMVFDGRYPNMRVDPAWYEPKDPLDYAPRVDDPIALYRPAPDNWHLTAPVLTLAVEGPDYADLTWTASVSDWYQTESYLVYGRLVVVDGDPGQWQLLATLPIERDEFGEITDQPLDYTANVPLLEVWEFYVASTDSGGMSAASNTVEMSGQYLTAAVLTGSQVAADDPITMSWTASTSSEAIVSYDVYVNVNSGGAVLLGSFGPSTFDATDPTVYAQGDVVQYFVRTMTASQQVDSNTITVPFIYSNVISASQAAPGDPVDLSWTAAVSSEAITDYDVYVQINGGGYNLLVSLSGAVFGYTDNTAYSGGDVLDYRVTALTASMSANSNVDSVTYQVPATGFTGTVVLTLAQDAGPPFINQKGYADPLFPGITYPGNALISNTTPGTIWEFALICRNFGPDIGKSEGMDVKVLSAAAIPQTDWTTLDIYDPSMVLMYSISSTDPTLSYSATDNGDGTWTSEWQIFPPDLPLKNCPDLSNYTFVFS